MKAFLIVATFAAVSGVSFGQELQTSPVFRPTGVRQPEFQPTQSITFDSSAVHPPTIRQIPFRRGSPKRDAQNAQNAENEAIFQQSMANTPEHKRELRAWSEQRPECGSPACDICLSQGLGGRMTQRSKTILSGPVKGVDNMEFTMPGMLQYEYYCDRGHVKLVNENLLTDETKITFAARPPQKTKHANFFDGICIREVQMTRAAMIPNAADVPGCDICEKSHLFSPVHIVCGWSGAWSMEYFRKTTGNDMYSVTQYKCERGHSIDRSIRVQNLAGIISAGALTETSTNNPKAPTLKRVLSARKIAQQQQSGKLKVSPKLPPELDYDSTFKVPLAIVP